MPAWQLGYADSEMLISCSLSYVLYTAEKWWRQARPREDSVSEKHIFYARIEGIKTRTIFPMQDWFVRMNANCWNILRGAEAS